MRSQDLRLARHSIESNLDLTVSLLQKVTDDDTLAQSERDAAGQLLVAIGPIHGVEGLEEEERYARLAPIVSELHRLDEQVNGPLPSEA